MASAWAHMQAILLYRSAVSTVCDRAPRVFDPSVTQPIDAVSILAPNFSTNPNRRIGGGIGSVAATVAQHYYDALICLDNGTLVCLTSRAIIRLSGCALVSLDGRALIPLGGRSLVHLDAGS
jgi:hypothetical protein